MSKHTPGPWKAYEGRLGMWSIAGELANIEMTEANARLIAAAPELLAAAKKIEHSAKFLKNDYSEEAVEAYEELVAAIAKAEES